jgi:hypothetical protein
MVVCQRGLNDPARGNLPGPAREICAHLPDKPGEIRRISPNQKQELKQTMADFVQKTTVKTAVRTLANPIADVAAFDAIVQSVIAGNPFACVAYETAGVSHPPVEKSKENYVVKVVYQDTDAKTVGNESGKFRTIAGYTAGATALLGNAALTAAHGGTPVRDSASETFSATLKCRDPNGEIYMITFGRQSVNLTSYSDDAIRTKVETWADTVAALA